MPNITSGQNQVLWTPWQANTTMRLPAAIPATTALTFYTSQAVMRDANGNAIQCDDTVRGEFIGFIERVINQTVQTTDVVQQNGIQGDVVLEEIIQPHLFMAQMASVAAGQEGQKVYWQFNNQVQFAAGNNGNFAGTVWQIFDSTHAWILPPWLNRGIGENCMGYASWMLLSATATTVNLTKWDVGRVFQTPATVAQTINLPDATKCSSGDSIIVIYTGATAVQVTLAAAAGQTINGAATILMGTTQYSKIEVGTDGSNWFQIR